MLPASWAFDTIEKGIRYLNAENLRSLGQRASKLPVVKLWNNSSLRGIQPGPNAIAHALAGMAEAADFFLRTPTLTASNFADQNFQHEKI